MLKQEFKIISLFHASQDRVGCEITEVCIKMPMLKYKTGLFMVRRIRGGKNAERSSDGRNGIKVVFPMPRSLYSYIRGGRGMLPKKIDVEGFLCVLCGSARTFYSLAQVYNLLIKNLKNARDMQVLWKSHPDVLE